MLLVLSTRGQIPEETWQVLGQELKTELFGQDIPNVVSNEKVEEVKKEQDEIGVKEVEAEGGVLIVQD